MDIDGTFLPVAVELIDQVFPTSVTYRRMNGVIYDPATGEVVQDTTEYSIKAGILSRERTEEGVGEEYLLNLGCSTAAAGCRTCPRLTTRLITTARPGRL